MNVERLESILKKYTIIAPIFCGILIAYYFIFGRILDMYPYFMEPLFFIMLLLFIGNIGLIIFEISYGTYKKEKKITQLGLFGLLNQLFIGFTLLVTFAVGLTNIY